MKNKIKIAGTYQFLAVVIFFYTIAFLISKGYTASALKESVIMFFKIMPILLLAFAILWIINYFIAQGKVKKILTQAQGARGWVSVIVAGVLIGGPPYVLYPMLKEIKSEGLTNKFLAVFLFNRNVKIQFLPVSIYYFGWLFTLVISVYIIIFSVFNGIIISRLVKDKLN